MRGSFIRDDSLVIPNNLTVAASDAILQMAFRNAQNINLFIGLCRAAPEPYLDLNQIQEPTIGVNGYARQPMARTNSGWPLIDQLADEAYIESKQFTWSAIGTGFDKSVDRLFICFSELELVGPVFSLSGLMPAPIRVKPETELTLRRFRYQIFLR